MRELIIFNFNLRERKILVGLVIILTILIGGCITEEIKKCPTCPKSSTKFECAEYTEERGCELAECPICPLPTGWSSCVDRSQSRTNYRCDASTDFQCLAFTEEKACVGEITKEQFEQKYSELKSKYREKLEQGYDVSEAKVIGERAIEAYNGGDYQTAHALLLMAEQALDTAEIPEEPIKQCSVCSLPSEWSVCVDGRQSRTNFRCSEETNFECAVHTEVRVCEIEPEMEWINEGPIYETSIDFYPNEKFSDLTMAIPGLKDLGIKTIWINPIWSSNEFDRCRSGYLVLDYYKINPCYGTENDLKVLVNTAHNNDMRVILTFVTTIGPFLSETHGKPADWFIQADDKDEILSLPGITVVDKIEGKYKTHYGEFVLRNGELIGVIIEGKFIMRNQPHPEWGWAVDRTNPEVINYFVDIARHYVQEYDIDGYYIDAPQNNSNSRFVSGDHTATALLRNAKKAIESIKSDAIFLPEWPGPECEKNENCDPVFDEFSEISFNWRFSGWLSDSGFDNGYLDDIINNRVASIEFVNYFETENIKHNRLRNRFMNNHDTKRVKKIFPEHNKNLAVLISTVPGVPEIWAGDELGLMGFYKNVFKIRRENVALQVGDMVDIWNGGDKTYAYMRSYRNNYVIVVLNFNSYPTASVLSLPTHNMGIVPGLEYTLLNALNEEVFIVKGADLNNYRVNIEGYGAKILILK
jgi:glycosidase